MAIIAIPNPLTDGTIALGSEVIADINVMANDYNGNITNANLAANAGIVDTKLAQISTGAKVSGAALTSLASIPSGAGVIPVANLPGGSGALGQCRLVKSGANLVLQPYNGNQITISGTNYSIPAAGVSLAPPATNGTNYLIYAYMNTGTMTLETSATAHATDSTSGNIGVEIKNGDNTRTLVGQARTVSSAWVDTATQRFVVSWFNRQNIPLQNTFSTNRTTTSATYAEINAEIQCQFLTWGTEAVFAAAVGTVGSGSDSDTSSCALAFDSTSTATAGFECQANTRSVQFGSMTISGYASLAEGYHYATILGAQASGTGTWHAATSVASRTAKDYINLMVRG